MISEELGFDLKETTMDQLGRAKSVKVQKENTVIVDGCGDKKRLKTELHRSRKRSRRRLLSLIKKKLQGKTCKTCRRCSCYPCRRRNRNGDERS